LEHRTTYSVPSTVKVRTSYLPSEILWGQRFSHQTVEYDKTVAKYAVSYKSINDSQPDRTPRLSARDYDEKRGRKSRSLSVSSSRSQQAA